MMGGMIRRSFARTDIGRRRRGNEDSFFRDDELGLYMVADGMGGHAAGEVASREAIDTVHGMIRRGIAEAGGQLDEARAYRLIEASIQAATYVIYAMAELDKKKSGMGTTMSAALVVGGALVTGQVGDSRIYRVREGLAEQLTEDHTLIAWQIKQGLITLDEAKSSPHRNVITRAVGNREYVEVDTSMALIEPGDRYLLCSDGLYTYFEPAELAEIVALGGDPAVDRFIELANQRGGRDNITAILVEVDEPRNSTA